MIYYSQCEKHGTVQKRSLVDICPKCASDNLINMTDIEKKDVILYDLTDRNDRNRFKKDQLNKKPYEDIDYQAVAKTLRAVGVPAFEAGKRLADVIKQIPDEVWDQIDAEIKRRGL